MHCSVTRKVSFDSEIIAEEALISHQSRQFHQNGGGPINVYQCEHCNAWHFTSKGPVHPKLLNEKGDIDLGRESSYWERRLR